MTTLRHLATSPNASTEAVRLMPQESITQAAEMIARMPALRAAVRRLAMEQEATDAGDVQSAGAGGELRGTAAKPPRVTSGPRSVNSEVASQCAVALSGRGPSAVRELVG